jgi:hypothetical protein
MHPGITLAHTGNANINFLNIRLSKFAGNLHTRKDRHNRREATHSNFFYSICTLAVPKTQGMRACSRRRDLAIAAPGLVDAYRAQMARLSISN